MERTIRTMAHAGFDLATPADIRVGREAAAALVGDAIATAPTMIRVQARSGCTVFVARSAEGELVAAVSAIPLTAAAAPGLAAGRFDGLEPPDRQIARPRDTPVAFYVWGAAGLTWRGRRLALAASLALQREAYPRLPLYARAATDDGARVLQRRMGAHPMPGGLVTAPAWDRDRKAA
jgi:hypothetical protein